MLLPHWTDGCIGSMEGLFFEASGTTPYHFLTTAAMSKQSSNPVRELRYVDNDASVGVPHLQALGVRYAMVRTEEAKREAREQPELTLLATVGPWEIYQVAESDIVVPLDTQPVVVERRGGDQRERNLELGTSWFQHPEDWAAFPADDGPDEWQRIKVGVDESRQIPDPTRPPDDPDTRGKQVDIVVPQQAIEPVPLDPVQVSDVEMGQQDLSFRVDQRRRARAGEGELLPELGGRRRRRPVPGRPQPDGRRADRQRGPPALRPERVGAVLLRSSPSPASACWCSSACGATNGSTTLMRPAEPVATDDTFSFSRQPGTRTPMPSSMRPRPQASTCHGTATKSIAS